jgi:FtsH-binding integral membrane protein
VAWAGPDGAAFRPAYEAALQLALVPLLLVQPALEIILVRLSRDLQDAQDAQPADLEAANRRVTRRFLRRVAAVTAAYCALAAGVWLVAAEWGPSLPLGLGELVQEPEGRLALWAALVGYGCLVAALGLCAAFQLLSRPGPMVVAGALAVAVNLTVGLVGRAVGPPGAAALGLLAGCAAFLLGMLVAWARARRRLDHLWCTAF